MRMIFPNTFWNANDGVAFISAWVTADLGRRKLYKHLICSKLKRTVRSLNSNLQDKIMEERKSGSSG